MSASSPARVHALTRFGLNSPNAGLLVMFYEQALGAQLELRERLDPRRLSHRAAVQGGAERSMLRLGDAIVEVLEFDHPGEPYPPQLTPYDTRFQHFCIVVTDMQRAMERLSQTAGWTAISSGGPQTLSVKTGGVTAFKFRDPDGHPLEFLHFAADKTPAHWRQATGMGIHLGIDHSALSVANQSRSVRFYQSLGLTLTHRTLNQGIEQGHLDGVPDPVVDVISLSPRQTTPHVELLHYHRKSRALHEPLRSHDTAATRLVFIGRDTAGAQADRLIQDPDGHFLQFDTVPGGLFQCNGIADE
ncbi:MAG: VOC family protein [Steroidobacteraceae bacterium]